jgi:SAM-dependent methyltransferase
MNFKKWLRKRLGESYWVWRLYHLAVSDAVSIQRPTKFRIVYEFLGDNLGRVADIGCGPGVFIQYLCERATQVFAADIDESALGRVKARHRKKKNLHCVVTLVDRLPFADNGLDTVLLLEVLEHLVDDAAEIREIRRVLAPGGKLVLSVPVPPGEINESDPWGHKREGYQLEELRALLESNGFEVQAHHFAQFRFSRVADKLVQRWRNWLRLPAPIFLSWVCYLDYILSSESRRTGGCLPSCVLILARKAGMSAKREIKPIELLTKCKRNKLSTLRISENLIG